MTCSAGDLLRYYRERSTDVGMKKGSLSQERLGELLGLRLEKERGYTFQTVSNWETCYTKPSRKILIGLIYVLRENGGITNQVEANELTQVFGYSPLDSSETKQLFPELLDELPVTASTKMPVGRPTLFDVYLNRLVIKFSGAWQKLKLSYFTDTQSHWSATFLRLLGDVLKKVNALDVLRFSIWLFIWVLTLWMIFPFMQWPFTDKAQIVRAAWLFSIGTVAMPLLVGGLAYVRRDTVWHKRLQATKLMIGLYTYQGATIGFQTGSLVIFSAALVGYHTGLGTLLKNFDWLLRPLVALVPIVLGYAAARQVPHNLWKIYERLHLKDGAIFFFLIIAAPAWTLFFYMEHSTFLDPFQGPLTLLIALIVASGLIYWQGHRTGMAIIPVHWWIVIYGTMLIAYLIKTNADVFEVVSTLGLIATLFTLWALDRIKFTLVGGIGLLVTLLAIWLSLQINIEVGRGVALVVFACWLFWRRSHMHLWLPWEFWLIIAVASLGEAGISWGYWTSIQASVGNSVIVLGLIAWLFWRKRVYLQRLSS